MAAVVHAASSLNLPPHGQAADPRIFPSPIEPPSLQTYCLQHTDGNNFDLCPQTFPSAGHGPIALSEPATPQPESSAKNQSGSEVQKTRRFRD